LFKKRKEASAVHHSLGWQPLVRVVYCLTGRLIIWFLCNREKQIEKKFSGPGISLQSLPPQSGPDLFYLGAVFSQKNGVFQKM
jgi:hypothetical protein